MIQWKLIGHKRDNDRIALNVSATLLSGATACSFLTNLEVSSQDYAGPREPFEFSDLTDNLHNAPVLKQLTLRDIRKLCIGDLAILHSQSPMLQDLALENINLKRESTPISNVDNSPTQHPRSFTLVYFIVEPERWHPGYPVKEEEELTIMEWFDFFGEKYKCIESLEKFHANHVWEPTTEGLEPISLSTSRAVGNMVNLKKYCLRVYPIITSDVMAALDINSNQGNGKLEILHIKFKSNEELETQLQLLISSPQIIKGLKSLSIEKKRS